MNELTIFKNEDFGEVRTVTINDEPYFVGKDVALILGYKDPSDALKRHVDEDDKLTRCFTDSGQNREMYVISESGLYSLILSSKLPSAKKFKRWVTSEVLPEIRKTGAYSRIPKVIQKPCGYMPTRLSKGSLCKSSATRRYAPRLGYRTKRQQQR